jgi:transcriptional regulator with XRE-family HTH domain
MANHRHRIDPANSAIGHRLRLARLEAGFITQLEAAPVLGSTREMVKQHELGYHRVSPLRLKRYAEVYGVPTAWLKTGVALDGERVPVELTEGWNRRLILARRVAGFVRKADVVKRYSVHGPHLYEHEAGEGLFRPDHAAMYAKAYSVSADWLQSGTLSGLPEKIVANLDQYLATYDQADDRARTFLPVIDPARAGPIGEVVALLPRLTRQGPRPRREGAKQDGSAQIDKPAMADASGTACQENQGDPGSIRAAPTDQEYGDEKDLGIMSVGF